MNGLVFSGCGWVPPWFGRLGWALTQASMGPPLGKARQFSKIKNKVTNVQIALIAILFISSFERKANEKNCWKNSCRNSFSDAGWGTTDDHQRTNCRLLKGPPYHWPPPEWEKGKCVHRRCFCFNLQEVQNPTYVCSCKVEIRRDWLASK